MFVIRCLLVSTVHVSFKRGGCSGMRRAHFAISAAFLALGGLMINLCCTHHICAICARYFSEMESKVMTVFLGLYRTIHTTGADVFSVIENCIAKYDLVIENMIGFGCDGASHQWSEVTTAFFHEFKQLIHTLC